jgi:hypothetical protein
MYLPRIIKLDNGISSIGVNNDTCGVTASSIRRQSASICGCSTVATTHRIQESSSTVQLYFVRLDLRCAERSQLCRCAASQADHDVEFLELVVGVGTRFPLVPCLNPWLSLGVCISRMNSSYPSPGGVAQLVERVLYHSTRRAVPERSWVQSLLPSTEVEPGFSTFGGMLVPVLQLISPVCKTGTSPYV